MATAARRLPNAVSVGDHGTHHQVVAIVHQRMSLVAEDRSRVVALAIEAGIRIGCARVGVVAAHPDRARLFSSRGSTDDPYRCPLV